MKKILFESMITGRGSIGPKTSGMQVMDIQTGGVMPMVPASGILGFSEFAFSFFNEGGSGNLLPGRPVRQQQGFQAPREPWVGIVMLRGFQGAFVTNGGRNLGERPLGQFFVTVFFVDDHTIGCTVRLSDSNSDDPVKIDVAGHILFFKA